MGLIERYLDLVRDIAIGSGPWLAFNATLATIPALLSVLLFHRPRDRTARWWVGAVAFLLFLPNAPYVVTDLIHLRELLALHPGSRTASILPAGALALLVIWGLSAYAVCLAEVDRLIEWAGWRRWRLVIRTSLHLVVGFGVVLGRVPRLHSWYVVTRPHASLDGIVSVMSPWLVPLVVVLAVLAAFGAAAMAAIGRAAWDRTTEVADQVRTWTRDATIRPG